MIEFHTALILFTIALILGAIGGGIFIKYSLRESIGFAIQPAGDGQWYEVTVIREKNQYRVFANGELISIKKTTKHGSD